MNYEDALDGVFARPGMYMQQSLSEEVTYRRMATYIWGFDHGSGGRALDGFREFCVAKLGPEPNSLVWEALVLIIRFGTSARPDGPDQNRQAIAALRDLLTEFFAGQRSVPRILP